MIKQVHFLNENNKYLCGILSNEKITSPIIILVHGFAGNKDENGLFIEAENYFSSRNINTFRFDFEGAGDSKGEFIYSTLEKQTEDFKSAVDYVSKIYPHENIGVIGFSLGATVSLLANDSKIKAYSLWSPALFPKIDMFPRYNTPEIQQEIEEKGFIDKIGLKVGKEIIQDLGNCSLEENIRNLNKPVLLVHGTSDPRINYMNTVKGKDYFKNAKLELIENANHSYKNNDLHRKILFEKTAEFFEEIF